MFMQSIGMQVEDGAMVAAGAVVAPGTVVKSGEIWGGETVLAMRWHLRPVEKDCLVSSIINP